MENENQILLYRLPNGDAMVEAVLKDETLWLTQKAMAQLFGVGTQAITKHLHNIFASEELKKEATCSKMEQVQTEGNRNVRRSVDYFNLDAVIAVGYRVNSKQATLFRQWLCAA